MEFCDLTETCNNEFCSFDNHKCTTSCPSTCSWCNDAYDFADLDRDNYFSYEELDSIWVVLQLYTPCSLEQGVAYMNAQGWYAEGRGYNLSALSILIDPTYYYSNNFTRFNT